MRHTTDYSQLAEVFIQSYKDSVFSTGLTDDFFISWVCRQIANPLYVVPCGRQLGPCAAPDAGVEQDSHTVVSASIGSTRSCSTNR